MNARTLALTSLIATTGCCALTVVAEDDYVGGTAVVLLTDEFVQPLGANVLAANLPFPGNPFVPMMGGGAVPLYDAASLLGGAPVPTNQVMSATRTGNEDGTVTITVIAQTQDGAPFVTESTPTQVLTLQGPQEANEFRLSTFAHAAPHLYHSQARGAYGFWLKQREHNPRVLLFVLREQNVHYLELRFRAVGHGLGRGH